MLMDATGVIVSRFQDVIAQLWRIESWPGAIFEGFGKAGHFSPPPLWEGNITNYSAVWLPSSFSASVNIEFTPPLNPIGIPNSHSEAAVTSTLSY